QRRPAAGLTTWSGSSQAPVRVTLLARVVLMPSETSVLLVQPLAYSRPKERLTSNSNLASGWAVPIPSGGVTERTWGLTAHLDFAFAPISPLFSFLEATLFLTSPPCSTLPF